MEEKKEKNPYKKLIDAIINGNIKKIQNLLKEGIDISSSIDENKQTILHIAAHVGHFHVMEFFLSFYDNNQYNLPSINAIDEHGWTALLCASSVGHIDIIYLLLSKGANPTIYNHQNTTPIHYLCRKNLTDLISQKKKKITNLTKTKEGDELTEYISLLELLISKGVDVNQQNYLGETALMQAAGRGNITAVKFLLDHKAKWKTINKNGETVLFYAEKSGCPETLQLLKEKEEKFKKKKLITHENIKLDNVIDVINLMKNGIPLKERKHFFITYKESFLGSDMVDWILRNLPIRTREEAVEYCQKLLNLNWIASPYKKTKFKDSKNSIYTFSSGESQRITAEIIKEKVTLNDFQQLKVIGKGGFGKVFLVKKKDTNKIYALKMMDKKKIMEKPRDFKNLMSEKKILQNDCCFLVHLHWAFQTETDFCLVMDFIGGGDLYYHLKNNKKFSEKVVQFIAAELIIALGYLHSCGIIYRDLKPQNILLDTDGHICLADFGLSKEVASGDTFMHTACGTPTYSAPEVLEGNPYSKAIDYWSLGIVLYQFLLGKTPFEFDGDFRKLLHSIESSEISYPSSLSENCILFLKKLLIRDPHQRLDDTDMLKKQPWFKGIDWEKLEVKKVSSPIKVTNNLELNFDPKFTNLPLQENKEKKTSLMIENFTVIF